MSHDPMIDLTVDGPTEDAWAAVVGELAPFMWPDADRIVIVSPHPDDETLGVGGLAAVATGVGRPVLVVTVTDGEAASPCPGLDLVRRRELANALCCLGVRRPVEQLRLGLPDGAVEPHTNELTDALIQCLGRRDLVICPLPDDGHPDHAATSEAATSAAAQCGASVRWFPVWAWHCHDPRTSTIGLGERLWLPLTARRRKRAAIACYRSQLTGSDPVVPPAMLARLDRPYEVLACPPG